MLRFSWCSVCLKSSLNMAAPASNCTTVEQQVVILFFCGHNVLQTLEPEIRNKCRGFSTCGGSSAVRKRASAFHGS